jgi:hypothetical protein
MANSPMEPSLADHVPAVTNRESPAWGSGRIPQAGLSYDATPAGSGSARPAVAIANPKVAILVPRQNALISFNQRIPAAKKARKPLNQPCLKALFRRAFSLVVYLQNQTVSFT